MTKADRNLRSDAPRDGDPIEIFETSPGLCGSWHPGVLLNARVGSCTVRYDELMDDTHVDKNLVSTFKVDEFFNSKEFISPVSKLMKVSNRVFRTSPIQILRPKPPEWESRDPRFWNAGTAVDYFFNDSWWEGFLLQPVQAVGLDSNVLVFFPDENSVDEAPVNMLRLSRIWNAANGRWLMKPYALIPKKILRLASLTENVNAERFLSGLERKRKSSGNKTRTPREADREMSGWEPNSETVSESPSESESDPGMESSMGPESKGLTLKKRRSMDKCVEQNTRSSSNVKSREALHLPSTPIGTPQRSKKSVSLKSVLKIKGPEPSTAKNTSIMKNASTEWENVERGQNDSKVGGKAALSKIPNARNGTVIGKENSSKSLPPQPAMGEESCWGNFQEIPQYVLEKIESFHRANDPQDSELNELANIGFDKILDDAQAYDPNPFTELTSNIGADENANGYVSETVNNPMVWGDDEANQPQIGSGHSNGIGNKKNVVRYKDGTDSFETESNNKKHTAVEVVPEIRIQKVHEISTQVENKMRTPQMKNSNGAKAFLIPHPPSDSSLPPVSISSSLPLMSSSSPVSSSSSPSVFSAIPTIVSSSSNSLPTSASVSSHSLPSLMSTLPLFVSSASSHPIFSLSSNSISSLSHPSSSLQTPSSSLSLSRNISSHEIQSLTASIDNLTSVIQLLITEIKDEKKHKEADKESFRTSHLIEKSKQKETICPNEWRNELNLKEGGERDSVKEANMDCVTKLKPLVSSFFPSLSHSLDSMKSTIQSSEFYVFQNSCIHSTISQEAKFLQNREELTATETKKSLKKSHSTVRDTFGGNRSNEEDTGVDYVWNEKNFKNKIDIRPDRNGGAIHGDGVDDTHEACCVYGCNGTDCCKAIKKLKTKPKSSRLKVIPPNLRRVVDVQSKAVDEVDNNNESDHESDSTDVDSDSMNDESIQNMERRRKREKYARDAPKNEKDRFPSVRFMNEVDETKGERKRRLNDATMKRRKRSNL